jgi:hypothetical protein
MSTDSSTPFRERLWPSPWLLVMLLLLIPAGLLAVTPLNAAIAPYIAVGLYLVIAGSLTLMSPTVEVADGRLSAGNANVPVTALGQAEVLGDAGLRRALGPGADARAYLMVRGYIHRAVRVEVTDPEDPTPYWIITTRRPKQLAEAIASAKQLAD